MHIMGGKTKRADAPWSKQKTPCKKIKNIFLLLLLLPNLFMEGVHMGKIRVEKKDRDRKKQKKVRFTTQMTHLYGGCKISRTNNNSNSSNSNSSSNNSKFGGVRFGWATPLITCQNIYKMKIYMSLLHAG